MEKKKMKSVIAAIGLFIAQGAAYLSRSIRQEDTPFHNLAQFIGYNIVAILGLIILVLAFKKDKPS
jgi:ABC-type multidrug transport system permease subunit